MSTLEVDIIHGKKDSLNIGELMSLKKNANQWEYVDMMKYKDGRKQTNNSNTPIFVYAKFHMPGLTTHYSTVTTIYDEKGKVFIDLTDGCGYSRTTVRGVPRGGLANLCIPVGWSWKIKFNKTKMVEYKVLKNPHDNFLQAQSSMKNEGFIPPSGKHVANEDIAQFLDSELFYTDMVWKKKKVTRGEHKFYSDYNSQIMIATPGIIRIYPANTGFHMGVSAYRTYDGTGSRGPWVVHAGSHTEKDRGSDMDKGYYFTGVPYEAGNPEVDYELRYVKEAWLCWLEPKE